MASWASHATPVVSATSLSARDGYRGPLHRIAPFMVRGETAVPFFGERVGPFARDVVPHGDVGDARVPGIAGHLLRFLEGCGHGFGAADRSGYCRAQMNTAGLPSIGNTRGG